MCRVGQQYNGRPGVRGEGATPGSAPPRSPRVEWCDGGRRSITTAAVLFTAPARSFCSISSSSGHCCCRGGRWRWRWRLRGQAEEKTGWVYRVLSTPFGCRTEQTTRPGRWWGERSGRMVRRRRSSSTSLAGRAVLCCAVEGRFDPIML